MTISLIYLFFVNTLSILLGTFAANFALLWIIGRRAEAIEKEQLERAKEARKQFIELANKEMKRQQDYMKMEG